MTLTQVWGCLLILTMLPTLGAFLQFPWGDRHPWGGLFWDLTLGGLAVLLAQLFFPPYSPWELLSLLALTIGQYWRHRQITYGKILGGLLIHDWQITLIASFLGIVSLTLFRQIRWGTWVILGTIFFALGLRHGAIPGYWVTAIALGAVLGWFNQQTPHNRQLWQLFRPEAGFLTLDRPLNASQVGQDAATLSQLKALGYPVLPGWVLKPGDDLPKFVTFVKPSGDRLYSVRLSSETPAPTFHIPQGPFSTRDDLDTALTQGFSHTPLGKQALIVQNLPNALWSGITYSRPPLPYSRQEPITEAAPGWISPLIIGEGKAPLFYGLESPQAIGEVTPTDQPPLDLLREVAQLSRQLEHHQGSPQAVEWCFTGVNLWILRVRPVYHLHPVWTREWVATHLPQPLSTLSTSLLEVIVPGAIASIYNALGDGRENLSNLTLISHHRGYSYLNRSFWRRIRRRANLHFSDLQFRKARWLFIFRHPVFCYRYLRWERQWYTDFQQNVERLYHPLLKTIRMISRNDLSTLSLVDLVQNVEQITDILELLCTDWIRGEIILWRWRLTTGLTDFLPPLLPQFQHLNQLAIDIRTTLRTQTAALPRDLKPLTRSALFAQLAELPDEENFLGRLNGWLKDYGDGATVPWELAQKRWWEDSSPIRQQLTDLLNHPRTIIPPTALNTTQTKLQALYFCQGEVFSLCETFLAQLRGHFLAIARIWQQRGYLAQAEDIFWLKLSEVKVLITAPQSQEFSRLQLKIQYRRSQWALTQEQGPPPEIIYGQLNIREDVSSSCSLQKLQGQGVSSGSVIGRVCLCPHPEHLPNWGPNDILVTPFLHENFFGHLDAIKGIITTQGGMLSQGASLARQRQIPMVTQVAIALDALQPGQWVRLDGRLGQVELLDPEALSTDAN